MFTQEELKALKFWLSVISFQGTREQVHKPLEVYDAVLGKIERMLETTVRDETNSQAVMETGD